MNGNKLVLGLDISTKTIGISLCSVSNNNELEIIQLTHVSPKVRKEISSIESLFIKKNIFEEEFLKRYINVGISEVVIEEPLLGSNNINTVATLLRFNGMISEAIYSKLNVIPTYISSYDARKFAFPELLTVRKFDKEGNQYPINKIKKVIKDSKECKRDKKGKLLSGLTLFGEYPWDIDKKQIIWDKINAEYKNISWVYNKKNDLCKENYDMTDALTTVKAHINKTINPQYEPVILDYIIKEENNNIIIDYIVNGINNENITHKINLIK